MYLCLYSCSYFLYCSEEKRMTFDQPQNQVKSSEQISSKSNINIVEENQIFFSNIGLCVFLGGFYLSSLGLFAICCISAVASPWSSLPSEAMLGARVSLSLSLTSSLRGEPGRSIAASLSFLAFATRTDACSAARSALICFLHILEYLPLRAISSW